MLRFTKRADYGLMAIHYIAVHEELGAVSAKRIAEEFAIPPELLARMRVLAVKTCASWSTLQRIPPMLMAAALLLN